MTASNQQLFTLESVEGKGQGLVAMSLIPRGTRILAEAPLFTVPRNTKNATFLEKRIAGEVKGLTEGDQRAFFSLKNCHEKGSGMSPLLGICKTNVLPLGSNATQGGLFLEASRINHSCVPNAQNTWNAGLGKITIHAVVDIAAGEEITICYLCDGLWTFAARQRQLQSSFKFTCACTQCSLSGSDRTESEARRAEISRLDAEIGNGTSIIMTPLACLRNVRRLLELMGAEGIRDASVPRAYYDAFQVAIANGDQARARVFAQRSRDSRVVVEGEDSEAVERLAGLVERPNSHRLFGTKMGWRTDVNKTPRNMTESEFEKWLWRMK
jgi:SET domain